jgi:tRNA_anti-like
MMKHKSSGNLLTLLMALCALFIVFGCSVDGDENSRSSEPASATIEHWRLLSEFAENQVAADSRYTGKRIRVTGPIDFVTVENGRILARFGVPASSYTQLFVEFPSSQKAEAASIKAGQQVIVECTCRGLTSVGRLEMDGCILK